MLHCLCRRYAEQNRRIVQNIADRSLYLDQCVIAIAQHFQRDETALVIRIKRVHVHRYKLTICIVNLKASALVGDGIAGFAVYLCYMDTPT